MWENHIGNARRRFGAGLRREDAREGLQKRPAIRDGLQVREAPCRDGITMLG